MKLSSIASLTLLLACPVAALAEDEARQPEVGLVLAGGEEVSSVRTTLTSPPERTRAAWARFVAGPGAGWRGSFDATGAPRRVWGAGIAAPGAVASPEAAARHARRILEAHVDLLAPGSKASDFTLVTNHADGPLRTLGFVQTHGGLRVHGGQVSFRYKNDRLFMLGSEAVADVTVEPTARPIASAYAAKVAGDWVSAELGVPARVEATKGRLIVATGARQHHDVFDVRVRTERPAGLYAVYVDASTGAPVARRQLLMFTSGQVSFNVPVRHPGGARVDRLVSGVSVTLPEGPAVTAVDGVLSWTSSQAVSAQVVAQGPLVRVLNDAGLEAGTTTLLPPGGHFVWSEATNERLDAQLTAFVATQDTKAYVRAIAPRLTWLNTQALVTVNIADVCNAFSDGETTNFFQAGDGCENTARLPDVVAHETGHSVHFQAILEGVGSFDTSLSEGASDYLAATMTDDPQMGRGFFMSDDPLRDIDPAGVEKSWPADIDRDPHETGLIIAGALWDLRAAFIAELGREAGIRFADQAWYAILQRASDIPTSYPEVVALDDDDGDLSNGTPHMCIINGVFSRHGLVDRVNAGPGIGVPTVDASLREVSFPFMPHDTCPGSSVVSAKLEWVDRSDANLTGTVDMTLVEGGGRFVGVLPAPATPRVLRYRVAATFDDGASIAFPDNPADPAYELFIGEVIPLYCTDFESDPLGENWAHALEASMPSGPTMQVDDWQWGTPRFIENSSDPSAAYSGDNAIGNDLGQQGAGRVDGRYQGNSTTALYSPTIDTQGYASIHLQYRRWLSVEDGLNDQANIYGNQTKLWTNLVSERAEDPRLQSLLPHIDKEWRFHDVDLSDTVVDGQIQVKWELTANRRTSYGGWTIDDVCIVAVAVCGNQKQEGSEACDDGNTVDGDGCTSTCQVGPVDPVCGNDQQEEGEACDDGNTADGDACSSTCTLPIPPAVCGNDQQEEGEACDDGNTTDGDGCSSTCQTTVTVIDPEDAGCGCATQGGSSSAAESALVLAVVLGSGLVRRRRRPA